MKGLSQKTLDDSNLIKLRAGDAPGAVYGYGSVFGIKDLDSDIVVKGAFAKSISQRMPKLLWMHDHSQPIGKWTGAEEDDYGLKLEGELFLDVAKGKEAHAILKKDKSLLGLSIGYRIVDSDYNSSDRAKYLNELDLWEVSLVTFPANEAAGVTSVKSQSASPDERRTLPKSELEKALREHMGLSRREASRLISHGYKAYRDDEPDYSPITKSSDDAIRRLDNLFED